MKHLVEHASTAGAARAWHAPVIEVLPVAESAFGIASSADSFTIS